MKLRIRGNSIRLRLSRGEVETLAAAGEVGEVLSFGNDSQSFNYVLRASADVTAPAADFNGGTLLVKVPQEAAREWATAETVGIECPGGDGPRILIEKDFACLSARPFEDETDMFPNPSTERCAPQIGK